MAINNEWLNLCATKLAWSKNRGWNRKRTLCESKFFFNKIFPIQKLKFKKFKKLNFAPKMKKTFKNLCFCEQMFEEPLNSD